MPDSGASGIPVDAANTLGLALSGGGSRAAAFHRGTIQGLHDVNLLSRLSSVSSVSGGSVFAAAWMAAVWKGRDVPTFLENIGNELVEGFVARSITLNALKLVLPSYTRANLLAETFGRYLTAGMRLKDLPERPLLSINTSVMNTGQVGKFSRFGFSSTGYTVPGVGHASPTIPLPDYPVALAATASAAFPVGLPPVFLQRGKHIPEGWGGSRLASHRRLALTDGGVLENLGVQTLLKSPKFRAWNLIISDAGRREQPWNPGGFMNYVRGAVVGAFSLPTIERVMVMMNSKENRHMRLSAYSEIERTWLIESIREGVQPIGIADFLSGQTCAPRRRVLFIRLSQTLDELLTAIPRWRLRELAARANQNLPEPLPPIQQLLAGFGVDLAPSLAIHSEMGGDARIAELNRIGTHFSAMPLNDIKDLHEHARWQVHAGSALYWD
jgi:predicted acylesterase/phospholipase RssA